MTVLDYLAATPVVSLVTSTQDGRDIVTPIWSVLHDGVPYIRSGYGLSAAWYRRLLRAGRAAFDDHGVRYRVCAELVGDEQTRAAVDEAYRRKYRGHGTALQQAVAAPARDYTLRLIVEDEHVRR